jgi:hypothetical protein
MIFIPPKLHLSGADSTVKTETGGGAEQEMTRKIERRKTGI